MFNLLKNIKPDIDKKAAFRNILLSKIYNNPTQERAGTATFSFLNPFRMMPKLTASFLAALLVLGSFSGVALASQNALPGDTLYDVKLFTEDTRVFLTQDEIEKAILHLQFAQARLKELNNLANSGSVSSDLVSSALENYKNQLEKSKTVLAVAPVSSGANLAQILDAATLQNQLAIAVLAGKFGDSTNHFFGEAYDATESVNDNANLILFSIATSTSDSIGYTATSTNDDVLGNATTSAESLIDMMKKSENKIKSAEYKILEVERFINKKSEKYNINEAKQALENSKNTLQEAKKLNAERKYHDSFIKAMDAHTQAQDAKKIAERARKLMKNEAERREKDDDDDDSYQYTFFISPIANGTSSSTAVSDTNSNNVTQESATSTDDILHDDEDNITENEKDDDDDDEENEKNIKENKGKRKKD